LSWNIGKVDDAAEQYKEAKELALRIKADSEFAQAEKALEVIGHYRQGKKFRDETRDYKQSIIHFDEAIRIANEIGSPDLKLKCLRQKSVDYYYENDLITYYRINVEALALAEQVKNERDLGICLNNIGIYYLRIGEYALALTDSEKALDIARKYNNPQNIADALTTLSVSYSDLGEFDRSIDYLLQVLDLDKASPDREKQAMDFNNIGISYRRKGMNSGLQDDFAAAISYIEKALNIVRPGTNAKLKIKFLNNLGSVFAQTGRNQEALGRFQEALTIAEQTNDVEESSIVLNNIGIVYSNLGDYLRSTSYYQKAIDLATRFMGKGILWESYLDLANSQRKQNLLAKAEQNYRASIAIIEDLRSSIDSEELKATYFGSDKRMDAYHNLIDLYARRAKGAPSPDIESKLFEYLEKAKARAFLDSLEVSNIEISEPIDSQRANQEKAIVQEITKLYQNLLLPGRSGEQEAAFRERISSLEAQLDRVRREFRTANPNFAGLKYPHIASFGDARKALLDPRTVFLAYLIGNEDAYGIAVTAKTIKAFRLPPRAVLKSSVESYLKTVSDKDRHEFTDGYDLYRELVEPAISPEIKNLVIIPDDFLNYLPFETLPTSAEGKKWLVEKLVISYAPSISSLLVIRNREPGRTARPAMDLLAVGAPDVGTEQSILAAVAGLRRLYPAQAADLAPLPFAKREIEAIAALFPARKKTVLVGANASENRFKTQPLAPYRILHFATHGFIDDKNPSRSAIVLSLKENADEDGLLQTREIYQLRMKADLVVLSACQTALGQLLRGEGIEGLNRAFFYAGASSVLMTLWSIHDQAGAQFMERFYEHLTSADSIAAALRKAKLDMIASPYYSHPYYWAGYILNGDGNRVVFPGTFPFGILAGAMGAIALLIGAGISRTRKRRRPV